MKQIAWKIIIKGKIKDVVYFDNDMTEEQVRRSLMFHDGYQGNFRLVKES